MKNKSRARIMVLGILAMFVMMMFVPATSQNAEAVDWESVAIVGGGAAVGAGIGFAVADGPGALVGAIAGALTAGYLGGVFDDAKDPQQFLDSRDSYARNLRNTTFNQMEIANAQTFNTLELYDTSTGFMVESAEFAAQELWLAQRDAGTLDEGYDLDEVMKLAPVVESSLAYEWAMYNTYNAIFDQLQDLGFQFQGDVFDQMEWGIASNQMQQASDWGDDFITRNAEQNEFRKMVMLPSMNEVGIPPTLNDSFYWISNGSEIYVTTFDNPANVDAMVTLIYDSDEILKGTISTPVDKWGTTELFTLNDFDLDSGRYKIVVTGVDTAKVFGVSNKATVEFQQEEQGVVIASFNKNSSDATVDFISWNAGGLNDRTQFWYSGFTELVVTEIFAAPRPDDNDIWPALYFWTNDGSFDATPGLETQPEDIGNYVVPLFKHREQLKEVNERVTAVINIADLFAQATYNIMDVTNGSLVIPRPSTIPFDFSTLSDMENLTAMQIYSIWYAWVTAFGDHWEDNEGEFDWKDVNASIQSFNLLARGQIIDQFGNPLTPVNTIFSPFAQTRNITLSTTGASVDEVELVENYSANLVQQQPELQFSSDVSQQQSGYFVATPFNGPENPHKILNASYELSKVSLQLKSTNGTFPQIQMMITPAKDISGALRPDVNNPMINVSIPQNTVVSDTYLWYDVELPQTVTIEDDVTYFIVLFHLDITQSVADKYAWAKSTLEGSLDGNNTNNLYTLEGNLGQVQQHDTFANENLEWDSFGTQAEGQRAHFRLYGQTSEGSVNEWNQVGFAMVWDQAATISQHLNKSINNASESMVQQPGQQATSPQNDEVTILDVQYIPLEPGYTLLIVELWFDGNFVEELDLNVTTLEFIIPSLAGAIEPPPGEEEEEDESAFSQIVALLWLVAFIIGIIMAIFVPSIDSKGIQAIVAITAFILIIIGIVGALIFFEALSFSVSWYHLIGGAGIIGLVIIGVLFLAGRIDGGPALLFGILFVILIMVGSIGWLLTQVIELLPDVPFLGIRASVASLAGGGKA